jgi:hypothetical protein
MTTFAMETLLSLMRKIGVRNFQTGDWMEFVGLQSFGKFCRKNLGMAPREFRNKYRS